jgi:hypothetical protein
MTSRKAPFRFVRASSDDRGHIGQMRSLVKPCLCLGGPPRYSWGTRLAQGSKDSSGILLFGHVRHFTNVFKNYFVVRLVLVNDQSWPQLPNPCRSVRIRGICSVIVTRRE